MKKFSSIDTDAAMYRLITQAVQSGAVAISGVVCLEDDRPGDSTDEDITVNTLQLTRIKPQEAVSNINIYVPDRLASVKGRQHRTQGRARLRDIGDALLAYIETSSISGADYWVESDTIQPAPAAAQHFRNIRLRWSIH